MAQAHRGGEETYSVGEVARLAAVTVRALHHYDEIALLRPSMRTPAGYRRYTRDDLLRLQRIRLFRALDFSLDDVRALLDAPDAELRTALVSQRAALLAKLEETQSLVTIIDRVLDGTPDTREEGPEMPVDELFKDFRNDEFAREAEERWGSTAHGRNPSAAPARTTSTTGR
ncbi:MAG: MerR family transcriptional regulator [Chloroflexi bacterium]|nr:MAG: MerR family transcriptional regulator [Chloroflexota bacterium]